MPIARVQDHGSMQAKCRAAVLARPQDHTVRRTPHARRQRQHFDRSQIIRQGADQIRKPVHALDKMRLPLWGETFGRNFDPGGQRGGFAMGRLARGII